MLLAKDELKLQRAHSLRQNGKLSEAAQLYRQLVRNNAADFDALHFLGVTEAAAGDFTHAKIHMARSLSVRPPNIHFVENYATILFQAGDCGSAIEICQEGLELNKDSTTLLHVSALSHFKLGKVREALLLFDRLLAIAPKHAAALNERGVVLIALKQYDAALESMEKAIALDQRYAEAHLNRAILLAQQKRHDDALAGYDRALALQPALLGGWLGRGDVCRALKRLDDAVAAYDKALAMNPGLVPAWFGRANALYDLGRYEESLAAYSNALAA